MALSTRTPDVKSVSRDIKSRREEEILSAATALFAEQGYTNADTQALADRLGVGKGTLYRYFASKRELFLAAVDRQVTQFHEAMQAAIADVKDPLQRFARAVEMYLKLFADHPEFVELSIQERAYFKDVALERREKYLQPWKELFRDLIAAGRLRDVPVERITDVLCDLLHGTMFSNYIDERNRSPADQARDILDIAFYGMLSDLERSAVSRPPSATKKLIADG
jgi:AcrR family transcriptional regulator